MVVWGKWKCPVCGKEIDHALIYAIHILELHKDEMKEKEEEQRQQQVQFTFTLTTAKA